MAKPSFCRLIPGLFTFPKENRENATGYADKNHASLDISEKQILCVETTAPG
jgi:hypothetical protein